ncbi:hypothetical protein LXL04_002871 [Taraxacum kok-saghyz]
MAEHAKPTTTQGTPAANNHPVTTKSEVKSSSISRITLPLTLFSFLLSFPILFCVVWLLYIREGKCEHLLPLANLHIGIVFGLILLFVISNGVVLLRSRFLMLGLMVVMVPLVVILTIGLTLIGSYMIDGRLMPGSPVWLNMMVNNDTNWYAIESCIYNTRTCQDLAIQSSMSSSHDLSTSKLSSIESGCCIPPSICDMKYVNATCWRKNHIGYRGSNGAYDIDCDLWQNDATKLCYDCNACRKGFIRTLREKWYKLGVFLVVVTILLIASHVLLLITTMWERHAR